MPGELVVNADWYDYEAKYTDGGMDLVALARTPHLDEVRRLAVEVFEIVDSRGWRASTSCDGRGRCS